MHLIVRRIVLVLSFLITANALPLSSNAQTIFYGQDQGVTSLAEATNSRFQNDAWVAAANAMGSINTVDFEPPRFTDAPSLYREIDISQGVRLSANFGFIQIYSSFQNEADGFNTTSEGNLRARFQEQTEVRVILRLTFQKPIQAFGAYVTGQGNSSPANPFDFIFEDEQTNRVSLRGVRSGARFVGFTNPDRAVTQVDFTSINLAFGSPLLTLSLDDVRWVNVVPEPCPTIVLIAGFLTMSFQLRRQNIRCKSRKSRRTV
jgi:hypothetical protein